MTNGIHKSVFVGIAILAGLLLLYIAYSRPWYFTSPIYLSGLFLLEFLVAAVWMYRRVFFPLVVVAFLFAGVNLPVGVGFGGRRVGRSLLWEHGLVL